MKTFCQAILDIFVQVHTDASRIFSSSVIFSSCISLCKIVEMLEVSYMNTLICANLALFNDIASSRSQRADCSARFHSTAATVEPSRVWFYFPCIDNMPLTLYLDSLISFATRKDRYTVLNWCFQCCCRLPLALETRRTRCWVDTSNAGFATS